MTKDAIFPSLLRSPCLLKSQSPKSIKPFFNGFFQNSVDNFCQSKKCLTKIVTFTGLSRSPKFIRTLKRLNFDGSLTFWQNQFWEFPFFVLFWQKCHICFTKPVQTIRPNLSELFHFWQLLLHLYFSPHSKPIKPTKVALLKSTTSHTKWRN